MKTTILALTALAFAGCVTQGPDPDPIPPSPVVVSFTATPAKVVKGGTVTLAWEVQNATSVSIADVNKGAVSGIDNKLSGSVDVTVDATTAFLLTATNDRGARAVAVASANLEGVDPNGLVFAAYPQLLPAGEKGLLVWAAPGAKTVTITPMGGTALDLAGQLASGSVEIDPTDADTTYTLDADGTSRDVTVQRTAGITELTGSATLAEPGDSFTVAWKVTNATTVRLTSPGRGVLFETADAATIADGNFMEMVPDLPQGSVLSYRLEADGHGDTVSKTISVVIGNAPAITSFAGPTYAKLGGTFDLTWETMNADQIQVLDGTQVLYQSTSPAEAASGSLTLPSPAQMATYTLVAMNSASGDSANATATIDVVGDVTIDTFTAAPTTVAAGGDAVTLTWSAPSARRARIVGTDGLTVAWVTGTAAASGTATVYPNAAVSTYTLTTSNTLDPDVTATADVTVTAPEVLSLPGNAPFFEGQPTADIQWTLGGATSEIVGFPHGTVDLDTASTGFVDITATGTEVPFTSSDDITYLLSASNVEGFETFLYGQREETSIRFSTNGWFGIGTNLSSSTPTPEAIPGTTYRNVIAPLWADLQLGMGRVLWEIQGTAPDRQLIVQFDHVQVKGEPTSDLVFEAKVSQTGVVTFEYQTLDFGTMGAPALTIGVSGPNGNGVSALVPAAGSSLTFFGAKPSPLTGVAGSLLPTGGFVKVGTGYARADLSASVVRAGEVGITEVMYDPDPSLTEGEWIEVANTSAVDLDLQGWTLDFGNSVTHTIATSVPLPAGSVKVLGMTTNTTNNDGVAVDYAYGPSIAMDDAAGSVTLSNPSGYSSTVTWTSGTAGVSTVFDPSPIIASTDTGSAPAPTPRNCLAPATATYGSLPTQQRGTPGVLTGCFGYLMTKIPVSYNEIATTGTQVPFTNLDESRLVVNLGTDPVTLFGTPYTDIVVGTNGWILPGSATGTSNGLSNKTKPSTSSPTGGVIAPFWDDLDTDFSDGGVFTKRVATNEDPANPVAHWIVEWHRYTHWLAGDDDNFQVKFFDDGVIEFHYGTMISGSSSNYADGHGATVWLENPTSTEALVWSVNSPAITPDMAIRFTPVP